MPGYDGLYEVSDLGRVRSLKRRGANERVLAPHRNAEGSLRVALSREGRSNRPLVWQLVWKGFVGPVPRYAHISYLDGDKTNCALSNLDLISVERRRQMKIEAVVEGHRARQQRVEQRECTRCHEIKQAPDEFSWSGSWCKECAKTYRQEYDQRPENRVRQVRIRRSAYLKKAYDITLEEYETLLAAQGGVCAICGISEGASDRETLCVDHNHVTGQIRALLCVRCNFAVKDLGDDIGRARLVLAYIEHHHERVA